MIKPEYDRADSDGQYYLKKDVEWGIWPDDNDPGYLVPKPGARPVPREEATTA